MDGGHGVGSQAVRAAYVWDRALCEARGVGLIGALELVMDQNSADQYPPEGKAGATLAARAQARGLIVRALPGDVIGICPPLIITEAQIDELFDSLAEALSETEGLLRRAA